MFWILISKNIADNELGTFLSSVFPEMKFKIGSSFSELEKEQTMVIIESYTNTYNKKIEFWFKDEAYGTAFTQYVGQQLSLVFECDTVTEVEAEGHPYDQYNSLLIRGRQQFVIDDDGIEFDDYKPNVKYEWRAEIKQFDGKGRLLD